MSESLNTAEAGVVRIGFFPGFYESSLSQALDYEEESRNENEMEKLEAIAKGI